MTDKRGLDGCASALGVVVPFTITGGGGRPASLPRGRLQPVHQPIAFNHRKHVEEASLPCSTCHQYYETGEASPGLPDAEVCAVCHLEPQGKSSESARLVRSLEGRRRRSRDWKPLFRQPPHVFYSHRRHVVVAKLDCPGLPRRDRKDHGAALACEAPGSCRTASTATAGCGVSVECTTCHR